MSYVTQLPLKLAPKLKKALEERGFLFSQPAYTLFCAKKPGISCTLYESGKLVVQGKGKEQFIEFVLEPEIIGVTLDITPRIGGDEAGKGDYFGPLCIAAVYADSEQIASLAQIKVRDSKSMTDVAIGKLAAKIRALCTHQIVSIGPEKYNEMYARIGNLNELLAWGHATAIASVEYKTGCREVIVDQFASNGVLDRACAKKELQINLVQRTKGESDIVVAAASILARDAFVGGIDKLSKQFGVELPKGAANKVIEAGRKFVAKRGLDELGKVAKLHFKTTEML